MQINVAHLRESSTSGGYIDFAVFDASSNSGSDSDNERLLNQLTITARATGLKIDQAALVYKYCGRVKYFGSKNLVHYLSNTGSPRWTHKINV